MLIIGKKTSGKIDVQIGLLIRCSAITEPVVLTSVCKFSYCLLRILDGKCSSICFANIFNIAMSFKIINHQTNMMRIMVNLLPNGFQHPLGSENELRISREITNLHNLRDLPSKPCANLNNTK